MGKLDVWILVRTVGFTCVVAACMLWGGCSYSSAGSAENSPVRVTFLDVGQGLAVLLESGGRYALYDAGPDSVGLGDLLCARGVTRLEWVLVSHGHRDHGGGFLEMGEFMESGRLRVGRLLVGPDTAAGFVRDSALAIARRFDVPVDTLFRGDTVYLSEGVVLESLWPVSYGRFGENRASVVLKVTLSDEVSRENTGDAFAGASLLLTGDLDSVGERRLLELSPDLKADLLQVAHHGSSGSNTLRFLSQVAPRYAAVSAGKNNRYGHPADDVLQKLRYVVGDSLSVFRTDLHGSIAFEMWPGIKWPVPFPNTIQMSSQNNIHQ